MPDPTPDPQDPKPDPAPDPTPDPTPDPKPEDDFDKDRALSTIRKQRESEAKLKAELRAAKEKAELYDKEQAAKLSDQERLAKEAEEAKAKAANADQRLQRANLIAELAKPEYGIVDARAAAKLIEGVEYDEDGEPTNLGSLDGDESLLAKFLTSHSFLRGEAKKPAPPSIDGREGTGGEKPPQLTADELRMAERSSMSAEEYAAFRDADNLADLEKAGLTKQD